MKILKKSLALIVALAMLASLVVVNVVADEAVPTVTAVASAEQVIGGSTFTVDINMSNNPGIVGMKLYCVYNTDAFELTAIDVKNVLAGNNTKALNIQTPGNTTLYWIDDSATENNTANGTIATLSFDVKADAELTEEIIDLQLDANNIVNFDLAKVTFTAVDDTITVTEEQWISSTEAVALGDIEYGADAPALPETVKGVGVTSRGNEITADEDPGVVLNVAWDEIDTFVIPADGLSVAGTVTTEESDLLKYKDADGNPIATPAATATYDIVKSTAGVVAPVAIDVEARFGGEATDVAGIVALEEIEAVTSTTIKLEDADAEEETVELDWDAAEPADTGDATLNLGTAEDSIVLNVPLTGTATYYDIDEMVAVVTITVKDAVKMYIETEVVTIETAVEYGAQSGPALPATVKGLGQTVGGQEIAAENGDDLTVVWDAVDTFQTPGAKTVSGIVAEPADDLIKFKNNDYTEDVDSLTATANYTIAKSKAGIVAPVATIEVRAKEAGVETGIDGLKVLEELIAVTVTTIAIEGGETEEVTLDWTNAQPASDTDTTLNLGSDSDSIVLNVPVTGDTTYYDLDGKFVAVTIQMVKPWIPGDVNADEEVTSADILVLKRHIGEWPEYETLPCPEAADVNGDGEVTSADILVLKRHIGEWPGYETLPYVPAQ